MAYEAEASHLPCQSHSWLASYASASPTLALGSIGFEYPGVISLNETCYAGFVKTPGAPTTLGNMIFWISKETSTLLESPTFSLEMNLNKYWS